MRILVLTHNYPRNDGDFAGLFVHTLNKALLRHGHEITVVCPHAPGILPRERLTGIAVERFRYLPGRMETLAYRGTMREMVSSSPLLMLAFFFFFLSFLFASLRHTWRDRPDVIHAHWWFPAGCIALVCSIFTGRRYLVTIHGTDAHIATGNRALAVIFRLVMRRAAAIVVGSEYLKGIVSKAVARDARSVAALRKIPMPVEIPALPEKPGTTNARGPILAVGRFTAQKNIRILLEALSLLSAENLRYDCLMIGDGPLRSEIEADIARKGLGENVRILRGVDRIRLFEHYRDCSLLVMPSLREGLGLVLVEALLMGKPVIAAGTGGGTEIIEHGVTGLLFDARDPETLARCIRDLMGNEELAARLARAGRGRALDAFSPPRVAEQYAQLYGELVTGRGRKRVS